jgi:hypothetical protein
MKTKIAFFVLLITGCLGWGLITEPAQAQTSNWIGSSDYWDVDSNWNPSGQPQDGYDVNLTQLDATNRTVYYRNSAYPNATLNSLVIDATGAGTMTLNQGYGGNSDPLLSVTEYVGYSGAGTHMQSSSSSNSIGSNLYLGFNPGSLGTYNLSDAANVYSGNRVYLDQQYHSYTWVGGNQYIGYSGTGTFNHSGTSDSVNYNANLYLGYNPGSTGTYNLSDYAQVSSGYTGFNWGQGIFWVGGNQYIGYSGTGTFTQSAPSDAQSNSNYHLNLYLGYNPGSTGTYNLSGSANINSGWEGYLGTQYSWVGGNQYIGYSGIGTFNHSAPSGAPNAYNSNYNLYLGYNPGSTGTYNLSDYASLGSGRWYWDGQGYTRVLGNQYIGYCGTGTFTQSGQSENIAHNLYLGYNACGSGTYNLKGGSIYSGNVYGGNLSGPQPLQSLYVGYSGSGIFNHTDGTITVNTLTLAANPGSSGTYNFQGGSLSAGTISVGSGGVYYQTGGDLNAKTLSNTGAVTLAGGTATVTGDVQNNAGGQIKVQNANVTWGGTFTNNGAYISDPSTQSFNNLIVGGSGYLIGETGDKFSISGNFINSTKSGLWNTAQATLSFTGNNLHALYVPGQDLGPSMAGYINNFAWGGLDITGQNLLLASTNGTPNAALYVGSILGVSFVDNTISNMQAVRLDPVFIYYDSLLSENSYLNSLTYTFPGGQLVPIDGELASITPPGVLLPPGYPAAPVPLPPTLLLLGSSLLGLAGWRRFRKG